MRWAPTTLLQAGLLVRVSGPRLWTASGGLPPRREAAPSHQTLPRLGQCVPMTARVSCEATAAPLTSHHSRSTDGDDAETPFRPPAQQG
jgi:hypothetical protein